MGLQLVGFFGSGVHADGVVYVVVLAKSRLGFAAVYAGAADIGQVLYAVVPVALLHIGKATPVGAYIRLRIGK